MLKFVGDWIIVVKHLETFLFWRALGTNTSYSVHYYQAPTSIVLPGRRMSQVIKQTVGRQQALLAQTEEEQGHKRSFPKATEACFQGKEKQ